MFTHIIAVVDDDESTRKSTTLLIESFGYRAVGFESAEALLKHVPLAAHIRRILDERPGHRAPAARFLRELEDYLSEEEAQRVLDTVIDWGRHAEIFAYDYDTEVLSLENF